LATKYKGNKKVIFGLMNEPHDMSTEVWFTAAQNAINKIRSVGAANLIFVSGNGWDGAHSWVSGGYGTANAVVAKTLTDPKKNMVFEVHQYLDGDYSGTNAGCTVTSASTVFTSLTNWLRQNGYKAFVGEWAGQDSSCATGVASFLQYFKDNKDVYTGWAWWVGGQAYIQCASSQLYLLDGNANAGIQSQMRGWLANSLGTKAAWTWSNPGALAATTSSAEEDFLSKYIYVLVGGVVLLILLVIVVLTLRSRSRKRELSVDGYMHKQEMNEQSSHVKLQSTPSAMELDVTPQTQETVAVDSAPLAQTTNDTETYGPDWEMRTDETGKQYYYNNATGVSQWETPDVSAVVA
jgi:hypothetical protein